MFGYDKDCIGYKVRCAKEICSGKAHKCFDKGLGTHRLSKPVGVVAQLVEHHNGIVGVRGSNPLGSTIRFPWRIFIKPPSILRKISVSNSLEHSRITVRYTLVTLTIRHFAPENCPQTAPAFPCTSASKPGQFLHQGRCERH